MPPLPRVSLIVADRELTRSHDGLTLSNVDPGGYEMLSANPADLDGIRPGATVIARCGLETIFWGRVNEPGQKQTGQRQDYNLAALGSGDLLKRGRIQEIWADSDLTRWGNQSLQRQINLASGNPVYPNAGSAQTAADTGSPALHQSMQSIDASTVSAPQRRPIVESWYDAQGIPIGYVYYNQASGNRATNVLPLGAGWSAFMYLGDSATSGTDVTANLASAASAAYLSATSATRIFAMVQVYFGGTFTGDGDWYVDWKNTTVYGRHGLTRRGSDPGGFYPDDIAWDAVQRAGQGIVRGRVDQASSYIVHHYTQLTPVAHETVPLDMAKLMGWHTGVWEPLGFLSESPAWYFHAPPESYTASVDRRECLDIDIPRVRLDQLYDTAKVAWRDPAGASGLTTVTLANPYLDEAGISGQILDLDMGVGSAAAASAYGTFALQLALSSARASGSATMPMYIRNAAGVAMPACLLKAGRDRLRITSLPDGGPWVSRDTRSFDTFRIKRVETSVSPEGIPRTRVEFDGGADLMEVLNARAAQAHVTSGFS